MPVKASHSPSDNSSISFGVKLTRGDISVLPARYSVFDVDPIPSMECQKIITKHPLYCCDKFSEMVVTLRQDNSGDILEPPERITKYARDVRFLNMGDTKTR
jgi:hypothetical protein